MKTLIELFIPKKNTFAIGSGNDDSILEEQVLIKCESIESQELAVVSEDSSTPCLWKWYISTSDLLSLRVKMHSIQYKHNKINQTDSEKILTKFWVI